jgi:hypothetical protein
MIPPPVLARMKQRNSFSCLRINRRDTIAPALVAVSAGERQVIDLITPAQRTWQNMVDRRPKTTPRQHRPEARSPRSARRGFLFSSLISYMDV